MLYRRSAWIFILMESYMQKQKDFVRKMHYISTPFSCRYRLRSSLGCFLWGGSVVWEKLYQRYKNLYPTLSILKRGNMNRRDRYVGTVTNLD